MQNSSSGIEKADFLDGNFSYFCSELRAINLQVPRDQAGLIHLHGSVVQWIVFQIPILKMQVRFLPGSLNKPTKSLVVDFYLGSLADTEGQAF